MAGSNTVVNTNIMALNTHRSLTNVGNKQAKASERLSSGLRINSAADDAAGLAISEKMRAQIRGLDMASKNSQDAISLIQTAEGGMQEIDNMLQRIRELVVQSANDTNDQESGDRLRIQEEINQLVEEIDSMSTRVEFNKKKVISGDYSDGSTKDIADIRKYQTTSTTGSSSTDGTTGPTLEDKQKAIKMVYDAVIDADHDYYTVLDSFDSAFMTINGTDVDALTAALTAITDLYSGDASTVTADMFDAALGALETVLTAASAASLTDAETSLENIKEILTEAKALIADTGLPVPAASHTVSGNTVGSSLDAVFAAEIGMSDAALSSSITFGDLVGTSAPAGLTLTDVATNWTALLEATTQEEMETAWTDFWDSFSTAVNLPANFAAAAAASDKFETGSVTADNLKAFKEAIGAYLADKLDAFAAPEVDASKGDASNVQASYDALLDTVVASSGGADTSLRDILADTTTFSGGDFDATKAAWTELRSAVDADKIEDLWNTFITTFNDEMTTYADLNGTPTFDEFSFSTLKDNFTTFMNDKLAALGATAGTTAKTGNSLFFQVGANADQKLELNINTINSKSLGIGDGNGESWIDVDKYTGSDITNLLTGLDDAVAYVTVERSKLGAAQNRLEYTIKSLDISSENLSSAESRIRDTDMAKEMMNYTQANVLQQAAISMLAQANQQPQNLLSLLR